MNSSIVLFIAYDFLSKTLIWSPTGKLPPGRWGCVGPGCRKSRQGSNPKGGRKAGAGRGLGGGGGVRVRRGQDGEKREGLGSLERVAL